MQDIVARGYETGSTSLNAYVTAFDSKYASHLDVNTIFNEADHILRLDMGLNVQLSTDFAAADNLSAVKSLISAPTSGGALGLQATQNLLYDLVNDSQNTNVSAKELNDTFAAYTAKYGAVTDMGTLLNAAESIADEDHLNSTDHFSSINTLLSAVGIASGVVDSSYTLLYMAENAHNASVTQSDLDTALHTLMKNYGTLAQESLINQSLSECIKSGNVGINAFINEVLHQDAIMDHLTNAQWSNLDPNAVAWNLAPGAGASVGIYSGNTAGNDTVSFVGDASSDTMITFGENGDDKITGGADVDIFSGNAGNDTLIGNGGNDYLIGGTGTNTLTGGLGADNFIFDCLKATKDTVTDFSAAQGDKLDLHDVLHFTNPATQVITNFVQFTTSGSNTIVSVDVDGAHGSAGWTQVATLTGVTGLSVQTLYNNGEIIAH
jgi:hypothetical protein